MTRESIPDFDLYAELEVSRLASAEVIDAAYRTLAKRHHPDVSRAFDAERIKRLNLAHDWLTDPVRRRRYDNATKAAPKPATIPTATSAVDDDPFGPTRMSSTKAFGINTAEVRRFLADLRDLDKRRAAEIHDRKAAGDEMAYAVAQHVAFTVAHAQHESQWLLAREAASVIVRGKLHGSALEGEVTGVAADVAGAIAIRDRMPSADFQVLNQPWVWNELKPVAKRPVAPTGAAAAPTTSTAASGPRATSGVAPGASAGAAARVVASTPVSFGRTARSFLTTPSGIAAAVAVIALLGVALALGGPKPDPAIAAATAGPSASAPLTDLASPLAPLASTPLAEANPSPFPSDAGPSAAPSLPPTGGKPGPTRFPGATPMTTATPTTVPTLVPTPAPTAVATPMPTDSPAPSCTVVSLINVNTNNAQAEWNLAGFTGTVIFLDPLSKPPWKIQWQSLTPGDGVPCDSDISVQRTAP